MRLTLVDVALAAIAIVLVVTVVIAVAAGMAFVAGISQRHRYLEGNHCSLVSETPTGRRRGAKVHHDEMRYVYACDFGKYVEER